MGTGVHVVGRMHARIAGGAVVPRKLCTFRGEGMSEEEKGAARNAYEEARKW